MRATSLRFPGIALVVVLLGAPGAGCDALSYYPEDCADELRCPGNPCPGECVPLPPLGFDGPALLWIGPESEAPECPARAPKEVYVGHAGLGASFECPPCECTQPACEFPAGVTASDTNMCQGPGFTQFDAPPSWGGACTAATAVITSNELRSVSIEPVTERPCKPVPPDVTHDTGPNGWGTLARACRGEAIATVCNDPGMTCLPSAEPPPPGFRQCIIYLRDGETQCPADYPDRFDFYGSLEDTRDCTPCACTQTAPSQCSARVTGFQDVTCTVAAELFSTVADLGNTGCIPILSASAELGSMDAEWVTNEPGTCATTGGEPMGQIVPIDPRIFCCQPPPGE
jgi:hypothetical protein